MEKETFKAHANLCGAKTRSGEPCKNRAMPNGRCRMHGGKSTGPKDKSKLKGNKNGVTTHERESIVFDFLDDDEKELLKQIDLDKLNQIDNEIKLVDIRLRRMMKRIQKLNKDDMSVSNHKVGEERGGYTDITESVDSLSKIQNIEDAITRVQAQKLKLIESKHKLEIDMGIASESDKAKLEQIKANTAFTKEKTKLLTGTEKDMSMLESLSDMLGKGKSD